MNEVNKKFAEMKELWEKFAESHNNFETKGVKKSAKEARAFIQELRSKVTDYRKLSTEACKTPKSK